jgi:hypothetical protein
LGNVVVSVPRLQRRQLLLNSPNLLLLLIPGPQIKILKVLASELEKNLLATEILKVSRAPLSYAFCGHR